MAKPLRLLVISDTHIPERATRVPPEIEDRIRSEAPFDVVVHAGDLVEERVLDWARSLGERLYVVAGNMDYLDLPDHEVFDVAGVRIGVVHGHQVYPRGNVEKLTRIAKSLKVEVLVSGHTHSPFVRVYGGVLHVNPGSLTGVWGGGGGSMKPSYAVIEVRDGVVSVKVYELGRGAVKVMEELEFRV